MKTKIIPKRQAQKMRQKGNYFTRPLDKGKYEWAGETPFVGKSVQVTEDVVAVFADHRRDKDGVYAKLMCLVKEENG